VCSSITLNNKHSPTSTTAFPSSTPSTPPPISIQLNADTGATGTFICAKHAAALSNLRPAAITVHLPDGGTSTSTHVGQLPLPALPPAALEAHVFPDFSGSLLSIGQICDADPTLAATFNHEAVRIHRGEDTLLVGTRDPVSKIYTVDVGEQQPHSACPVIRHESQSEMVRFYRAALGSPVWSTFVGALRSGIIHLPGLTAEVTLRNPDASIPSALGHLSLERQGLRSTKPPPPIYA
jgi:hypothetical protein